MEVEQPEEEVDDTPQRGPEFFEAAKAKSMDALNLLGTGYSKPGRKHWFTLCPMLSLETVIKSHLRANGEELFRIMNEAIESRPTTTTSASC